MEGRGARNARVCDVDVEKRFPCEKNYITYYTSRMGVEEGFFFFFFFPSDSYRL